MRSDQKIKVNNEDIRIRPSSVDNFFQCGFQWGKVFLEGVTTIPNARAAIGTSVHKAVETMWQESMQKGDLSINLSTMTDAAMDAWKEEKQKGMVYDTGENENTAFAEIIKGSEAYAEDIAPYAEIPYAVEEFFKVDLQHAFVKEIGGTVDYRHDLIADTKTSKRKPTPANYTTQQSLYRFLAEANGKKVKGNLIHGVVFNRHGAEGTILPLISNVPQAKSLVNMMLDKLDVVAKDIVPIETILTPNPKYYLCSPKYCSLYGNGCPATAGSAATKVKL